ncbi:DnaJ- protein scj1 [Paramecium bursaria]
MLVSQIGLYLFNILGLSSILTFKGRLRQLLLVLVFFIEVTLLIQANEKNYYSQYELNRTFDNSELRLAYKQILKKYHPDKNPNVSTDEFNHIRGIYDYLNNEQYRLCIEIILTFLVYDAYGPFKLPSGNIDTLSPIRTQSQLSRTLIYMLIFLGVTVQTTKKDYKSQRKYILIIVVVAYLVDNYLYENPDVFHKSPFFITFPLFEIIILFRLLLSVIVSNQIIDIKLTELKKNDSIKSLDINVLKLLEAEHLKYVEDQNSRKQSVINAVVIFGMIVFGVIQFI